MVLALAVSGMLALPARPDLWNRLTSTEWVRRAAGHYAGHVGGREARVSRTRSWLERAEEFRERPGDDPRADGATTIAGVDYGLAFRIAHAAGRRTRVLLQWDPVFARCCGGDPDPGASVLFVSRGAEPPAAWATRFREVSEVPAAESAGSATGSYPLRAWSCRSWHGGDPVATH
jgi:hypothetical protein